MILYFSDAFKKPCRFEPHVVVDIEAEFDRLVGMLHCHQSQFYEWLPYNAGHLDQVPEGDAPAGSGWPSGSAGGSGRWPTATATWSSGPTARSAAATGPLHRGVRGLGVRGAAGRRGPGPAVPVPARRLVRGLTVRPEGMGRCPRSSRPYSVGVGVGDAFASDEL